MMNMNQMINPMMSTNPMMGHQSQQLTHHKDYGKPVGNILGDKHRSLYYAYGIRNSFGFNWDPLTGKLWDTENGPHFGDEINLVTRFQ